MHDDVIARFWAKVDRSGGQDACWLWTGAKVFGYGVLQMDGQARRAHRISWVLDQGPIPAGLFVCHTCDNPSCVRPDHLFLGTALANNHDMIAKDRHTRGERVRVGKLVAQQVLEIRRLEGTTPRRVVAARYGVARQTIDSIYNRHIWKHLTDEPHA